MPSIPSNLAAQVANLPLTLAPAAFTADELTLIIGTYLPEAVFVLEERTGLLVAATPRFLEQAALPAEDFHGPGILFEDLVVAMDRPLLRAWLEAGPSGGTAFEIRLQGRDGRESPVEISFLRFRWMRRDYILGITRAAAGRKALERELRTEIEEQKRRTVEAIKSSVRIYQITEKIERTLALTKTLLNTENQEELFRSASRILTADGLNYREVSFLLLRENALEVAHSTRPLEESRFPLAGESHYARFVRSNFDEAVPEKGEVLVPLRSRGTFLGLIEVLLLEKERIFFDDQRMVSEWQRNVLLTIGDIIALHLDNLRLYSEVKRQSMVDPLTGAYNRHYFTTRLSAEINRASRNGRPLAMIFIDVDEFKSINDRHGHLQGDQVLRELGQIFRENLREEDCVCRFGGDEFVVLLPEVDSERSGLIAGKLIAAVQEHRFESLSDQAVGIPITISVGMSELGGRKDEDLFLQSADAALYQAKKNGRNRYEASPATKA